MSYQHILLALDLDSESEQIVKRADRLATDFGARLSLVFVEPGIGHHSFIEAELPTLNERQDSITHHHRSELKRLAELCGSEAGCQLIRSGDIATCVHEAAEEIAADLIICGEHHGFWHLSHSDRAISKKSPCDVLLIRL